MKKNISINISGIIFHIEEDAFDQLKDYLDSINRYFSTFNDSQEIIADIEGRIAEIFLTKLNDEKQVITVEDVSSLKTTMGSIRDFQAVEEEFEEREEPKESRQRTFDSSSSKKLFRDEKRRLVAGICAGIAHYFHVDALWIRLLFFILLVGSGGIILPVYLVMWAVVPASSDLSEDKKLKKMFRDPEAKVVAGVSSGIANYFGIDVVIVRVLFVISLLLGGVGLLTYILLWIVLPEAKSVSDKVQMKGDPITLSNIETNIKQNLNVKDGGDENIFVKLLLFPFRLVAMLLDVLGKAIGPFFRLFVDIIRILFGALLIFIGSVSIISMLVALGVIIGIFSTDLADVSIFNLGHIGIPFDTMTNGIPGWTLAAAVVASVVPLFFMILIGSSIIAKRIIFSSNTGWTLFAGLIISVIILAINVPMIAINFSDEGEIRETKTFELADKTAILRLADSGSREYDVTSLKLRGHSGTDYSLEQIFEAQGSSRRDAEENARMVSYEVSLSDSILYFDSNITFNRDAIFRAQRLDMTLYIPYGSKFMIDYDLREILRNTIYRSGYSISDLREDNVWTFTRNGLQCLTCENDNTQYKERSSSQESIREDSEEIKAKSRDNYNRQMTFDAFDEIEIEGAFIVNIENSDKYQVLLSGPSRYLDDLDIEQHGDRLKIGIMDFDNDIRTWSLSRDDIELTILTPSVNRLDITGACSAYMTNYNLRRLRVDLMGATSLKADIRVDDLGIELTGASSMELRGRGEELRADVMGASHLDAYEYKVRNADLEAEGVSSIKAFVTNEITIDESFISNIKYRGDARLNSRDDGF